MRTIPRAEEEKPPSPLPLLLPPASCLLPPASCLLYLASCLLLLASCLFSPVRPTVKIGLVAPFEGRYRYIGYDLFPAVRLALREVNRRGGVGGYNVELVAYDDGGVPEQAVLQARKLAVDGDVVAAIGHFREETTLAAAPLYAEAGIPLVVPGLLCPSGGAEGAVWTGPSADTVARALLDGVEEAALVTDGGVLGEAVQEQADVLGVRLAPVVSPDEEGWLEEVLTASLVLCDGDPVTAGEVVLALRGAGWRGEFRGGPDLAAEDVVAVAGEAAAEVVFVTPWPTGEGPEGYEEVSGGVPPGPLALPAYEAAGLVIKRLEESILADGVPSRAGMWGLFSAQGRCGEADLYWYTIRR